MCGIVGFWNPRGGGEGLMTATIMAMANTLRHRGPDSSGVWVRPEFGIALGHRRLAIVDLSASGHQPMTSPAGRFVIVFNGEIYNFLELKRDLEALGCRFRGASDTEVLLTAIERWGLKRAIRKCTGMFALAVWDARERCLHLVRDRFGEKPLYFMVNKDVLLFASELKALHAFPEFAPAVSREALCTYLHYGYIPDPLSIYEGVSKLAAGSILTLRPEDLSSEGSDICRKVHAYWSTKETYLVHSAERTSESLAEATRTLDEHLRLSVRQRMTADVPLGAFLSGGLDSSAVVALMQAESTRQIQTFTVGFDEFGYDESAHAKRIASHLGTLHTEMRVSPAEMLAIIPDLANLYDEPFADPSQMPTAIVCRLARRSVTVALSGDGGDELFGGYPRYWMWARLNAVYRLPLLIRTIAGWLLTRPSLEQWDTMIARAEMLLPENALQGMNGERLYKLGKLIALRHISDAYPRLVSHWLEPSQVIIDVPEPQILAEDRLAELSPDPVSGMMALDTATYLPSDILVKVDRASMASSLEVRCPFLDHCLAEYAWTLPTRFKVDHGIGKVILRRVLSRYLPAEMFERPKMGFSVPIASWLRGPLRPWAEELLKPDRLLREGFFRPERITAAWSEHLSGRKDRSRQLWIILMFQTWHEQWQHGPGEGTTAIHDNRASTGGDKNLRRSD